LTLGSVVDDLEPVETEVTAQPELVAMVELAAVELELAAVELEDAAVELELAAGELELAAVELELAAVELELAAVELELEVLEDKLESWKPPSGLLLKLCCFASKPRSL